MPNFKYYAIQYLDYWWRIDKRLVENFEQDPLGILIDMANEYKVARNFKLISDRWCKILDAINSVKSGQPIEAVEELEKLFMRDFQRRNTSAASKFLWVKRRGRIIIYDGNVRMTIRPNDYGKFYEKWREEYEKHEKEIQEVCASLADEKIMGFTLFEGSKDELSELVNAEWFHYRVFDRYLWMIGSVKVAEKNRVNSKDRALGLNLLEE